MVYLTGPEPRCFPFFGVCRLVVLKETEFLVSFPAVERPRDCDLDFERFGGPAEFLLSFDLVRPCLPGAGDTAVLAAFGFLDFVCFG